MSNPPVESSSRCETRNWKQIAVTGAVATTTVAFIGIEAFYDLPRALARHVMRPLERTGVCLIAGSVREQLFAESNPNSDRNMAFAITGVAIIFAIAVGNGMRFNLSQSLRDGIMIGGSIAISRTLIGVTYKFLQDVTSSKPKREEIEALLAAADRELDHEKKIEMLKGIVSQHLG